MPVSVWSHHEVWVTVALGYGNRKVPNKRIPGHVRVGLGVIEVGEHDAGIRLVPPQKFGLL